MHFNSKRTDVLERSFTFGGPVLLCQAYHAYGPSQRETEYVSRYDGLGRVFISKLLLIEVSTV